MTGGSELKSKLVIIESYRYE